MRVAVVGAGYVGLVAAACFADAGHTVRCLERDPARRAEITAGRAPFFEPGLAERVARAVSVRRLVVDWDASAAVTGAEVVFVAVGTPPSPGGGSDMSQVHEALGEIAKFGRHDARVVLKSTVPVGSASWARETLAALERPDLRVLSNPEFLAEGAAVRGFLEPDRVVIGARSAEDAAPLLALYRTVVPDHTPVLIMDHASAELAKYAANAMLATRVSLMNELAGLCEVSGADIERVREVVGADVRIGDRYLRAGAGFGGSCFPKDLLALEAIGANAGRPTAIVRAVRLVNERQRLRVYEHLLALLGRADAGGLRIAVWGVAFKPETDDLRESPAVTVIERLVADGAQVVAWDAVAIPAAKAQLDASVAYADDPVQAAEGADAVLLMTEWPELRAVDLVGLAQRMRQRIIVDGRNVFDPAVMDAAGFSWASIGRKPRHATLGREGI